MILAGEEEMDEEDGRQGEHDACHEYLNRQRADEDGAELEDWVEIIAAVNDSRSVRDVFFFFLAVGHWSGGA
jgi:hypothetical protein